MKRRAIIYNLMLKNIPYHIMTELKSKLPAHPRTYLIIIIIIISIFKEDNVFSITASLPYGPLVNTDIDYYRTFFRTCLLFQVLRG